MRLHDNINGRVYTNSAVNTIIIKLVAEPRNRTGPQGYEPRVLPSHSPAIVYLSYGALDRNQTCDANVPS